MPLYFSPYLGTGTRLDPFRPTGSDQPGWSAIDLRADGGASLGGNGFAYALLWLPAGSVEDPSLIKLGDLRNEALAASSRTLLASKTALDFSHDVTLADSVATLLIRPPVKGWKALKPMRGRLEAWLGSETGKVRWVDLPVLAGGSITDAFTRADESPVASPWTRLPGSAGGDVNLSSNGLQKITSTGDSFYYYARPDGWGADQSSEMTDTTGVTTSDWGPAVRIGSIGFSGYFYSQYTGVASQRVYKVVAGTVTNIEAALGVTTVNTPYKLEAIGSTINYYDNGIADANSPVTDTAIVSGGSGPGFFVFNLGGSLDNFTGTGEAATTNVNSSSRFAFSPARTPWKRQRLHPSQVARSAADLNLPPVIDETTLTSRSRFGWSPARMPMARRRQRASVPDLQISVVAMPDPASLTLTTFAPTVLTPVVVTPGLVALTLSTFAPAVLTPILTTPGVLALTLTTFAPTISTPVLATPGVLALTLSPFAPTVLTPVLSTPGLSALTLSTFAPSVLTPILVTPPLATLTLSTFAPNVLTPDLAIPSVLSMSILTFAPTVTASDYQLATPALATLGLTTFAPVISTTDIQDTPPTPSAPYQLSGANAGAGFSRRPASDWSQYRDRDARQERLVREEDELMSYISAFLAVED